AARYSLTWSSRTLSCSVLLAPEGMHQSFPRQQARIKQRSFPSPPVLLSARLKRYYKPLRHPPGQTRLHGTTAYTRPSLPRHTSADPGPGRASPVPAPTIATVPLPLPRGIHRRCTSSGLLEHKTGLIPSGRNRIGLFHVDVDELARPLLLVAVRRLERLQPPELAQPDPGQDPRHRRGRHSQRLGDLRATHPQPAQRSDRRDTRLTRPQRH